MGSSVVFWGALVLQMDSSRAPLQYHPRSEGKMEKERE